MADNKKMSVAEILAAARANKAAGEAKASGEAKAAPSAAASPAVDDGADSTNSSVTVTDSPPATAAEAPAAGKPAAKPAAAAKPKPGAMSIADILAAARADKGPKAVVAEAPTAAPEAETPPPVAAKPAAAKPAAAKPAAKPAAANAEGGAAAPKPAALDTASILAAARGAGVAKPGPVSKAEAKEKGIEAVPAKKKLEAPPMPAKPEYAQAKPTGKGAKKDESRRGFFASVSSMIAGSSLALGFTSLAVTHLLWVLGLARYFFPNILTEPPTKFKVGFPDTLAPGQVDERFKAQFGVWVVKHEYEGQSQIFALKTVCTHLGCTPNWLEAEQKFKCPCHGSGFYKDGVNFEGPAPRPLERYAIKVSDDGQLEVDKSRVFHEETGQWKDNSSFVPT
jgi:cytochrome b6-f complex iron-sulfur subunit